MSGGRGGMEIRRRLSLDDRHLYHRLYFAGSREMLIQFGVPPSSGGLLIKCSLKAVLRIRCFISNLFPQFADFRVGLRRKHDRKDP